MQKAKLLLCLIKNHVKKAYGS